VRPNDNCIAPMTGANWLKLEQEVKSEAVQNLSVTRAAAEVQCNLARKLHNQATYKTKALQVIQSDPRATTKSNKEQQVPGYQLWSRDHNLRDRDMAQISRRDRDLVIKTETETWKFETETSHFSDGN